MCKGVNGDAQCFFRHNANACTNCIATNEPLAARRLTHPTVGELLLNNAKYVAINCGQTYSITIHNINNPAISKFEFLCRPCETIYLHHLAKQGKTLL